LFSSTQIPVFLQSGLQSHILPSLLVVLEYEALKHVLILF
jgi:hypothetical protein